MTPVKIQFPATTILPPCGASSVGFIRTYSSSTSDTSTPRSFCGFTFVNVS